MRSDANKTLTACSRLVGGPKSKEGGLGTDKWGEKNPFSDKLIISAIKRSNRHIRINYKHSSSVLQVEIYQIEAYRIKNVLIGSL